MSGENMSGGICSGGNVRIPTDHGTWMKKVRAEMRTSVWCSVSVAVRPYSRYHYIGVDDCRTAVGPNQYRTTHSHLLSCIEPASVTQSCVREMSKSGR